MRTQKMSWKLLPCAGLVLALNACVAPPETDTRSPVQRDAAPTVELDTSVKPDANKDSKPSEKELVDSPVGMQNCALTQYGSKPLTHAKNTAIFNQFDFRPESVTVFTDTVAVKTANYTFYYCEMDDDWIALSNDEPPDDGYDLEAIANPTYDSIELGGEVYEYRTRLKADWLAERGAVTEGTENGEDTVFFDLKLPDGEEISRELYTVSDLQAARLGASLGVPEVAGAAIANGEIWFAATASQGEGDSGFASLLRYEPETETLSVERPEMLQGDQLTDLAATEKDGEVTLWLGTQRMGEGVPFFPASGLVAYQPENEKLETFTITNSPMVGAIPHALAVQKDVLWVATGDGICGVKWQRIDRANSWDCRRLTMTAEVPKEGVAVYPSFLASEAKGKTGRQVEVLWGAESFGDPSAEGSSDAPETARYEVVYEPGFEAALSQGGYRVADLAARRAAMGESIFWPGRQWHWAGDRFRRGLDEVGLNLVGGGPYGLVASTPGNGLRFDHSAIRGAFDLLALTPESTKVRYYSGWVEVDDLEVYPGFKPVVRPKKVKPNPLTKMASDLPNSGP